MITKIYGIDATGLILELLAQLGISRVERLKIHSGKSPSRDSSYQALLPMMARTYAASHSIDAKARRYSSAPWTPARVRRGVTVCPKFEELDIEHRDGLHIKDIIGMAAARTSGGARLKSVRIFNQLGLENPWVHVLELRKHVLHVEG